MGSYLKSIEKVTQGVKLMAKVYEKDNEYLSFIYRELFSVDWKSNAKYKIDDVDGRGEWYIAGYLFMRSCWYRLGK